MFPDIFKSVQDQFNKVIEWSQEFSPSTEILFGDWYKAKKRFIDWFGNRLIYEVGEVESHIDKEKKNDLINDFLDQCCHILTVDEYSDFYQFINANKDTFFSNIVSNDTIQFGKSISKGMRLSKAFKFFIKNKDELTNIQQLASAYIQKDKIKGKLCLSVHPLDYLSASENNYNWRSCHSLDGEYRAGNLSYMTDNVTICCYICGNEMEKLPNFPESVKWNSKKWRMWIHIDEDFNHCFLGRQYPFALSNNIIEKIYDLLPGVWGKFTNFHFKVVNDDLNNHFYLGNDYITLFDGCDYNLYPAKDVIEEGSQLNYNDLLHSSFYKPYYASKEWRIKDKKLIKKHEYPKIRVGNEVKCLCCNKKSIEASEGVMLCQDCLMDLGFLSHLTICDNCGNYIEDDEITYLADGTPICNHCLNNGDFVYCEECGEFFRIEETVYSDIFEHSYCESCYDSIVHDEEVEYIKKHYGGEYHG